MSASAAMRLQSVVCSVPITISMPFVFLHAWDWVDPLSHQMITDTSDLSRVTDIDDSSAAPQINALCVQQTHCPIMLSVLFVKPCGKKTPQLVLCAYLEFKVTKLINPFEIGEMKFK